MGIFPDMSHGRGAGSSLPYPVLLLSGISTFIAVVVSGISIYLHLMNYRKPLQQRMVARIVVMVPIYAISSLISLFSLEAAFFIDAVRDVYEAFVIYCFFVLLLSYLGGERELLIRMHGSPPKQAIFPINLFRSEIDISDPYTFLTLKRGILQYVQIKPLLALATVILKATGKYNEGDFRARSGYLYVSIVYNISICLSLYSLALFWLCVSQLLTPFRPVPKFLCVKGILFFSFWQSIGISALVAMGVINHLGPYKDEEHVSLGLTDILVCLEMPIFAIAHAYAFSYRDYTNPPLSPSSPVSTHHAARLRLWPAFRDAIGFKDVVLDARATLHGAGLTYRAFEPSEGGMHVGAGRERRIRAGLRYVQGGKGKYWLPDVERPVVSARDDDEDAIAPLLASDAAQVVHNAPDIRFNNRGRGWGDLPTDDAPLHTDASALNISSSNSDSFALSYPSPPSSPLTESIFTQARSLVFGDYNYPVVDVSTYSQEDRAQRGYWERDVVDGFESCPSSAFNNSTKGAKARGYGATSTSKQARKAGRNNVYDIDEGEDEGFASASDEQRNSDDRVVDFEEGLVSRRGGDDDGEMRMDWTHLRGGATPGSASSSASGSPGRGAGEGRRRNHGRNMRETQIRNESRASPARPSHTSVPSHLRPNSLQIPNTHSYSQSHPRSSPHSQAHSPMPSPSRHSQSHTHTPLLKEDAVDLVVPSPSHSPHSPLVAPRSPYGREREGDGLTRVYGRTTDSHPEENEPDDEAEEENVTERHIQVPRFVVSSSTDDDDDEDGEGQVGQANEEDMPHVTRTQTTPSFARLDGFVDTSGAYDEENPWA